MPSAAATSNRIVLIRPITFSGRPWAPHCVPQRSLPSWWLAPAPSVHGSWACWCKPDIIKVTAPVSATLVEQHVREGQTIAGGLVLFVLDTGTPATTRQRILAFSAGRRRTCIEPTQIEFAQRTGTTQVLLSQQRGPAQGRYPQALQLRTDPTGSTNRHAAGRVASNNPNSKRWQGLTREIRFRGALYSNAATMAG